MTADILIVRDGEVCRVLFGHLRLTSILSESNEAFVDVKGLGEAKITKSSSGMFVHMDSQQLPLLQA